MMSGYHRLLFDGSTTFLLFAILSATIASTTTIPQAAFAQQQQQQSYRQESLFIALLADGSALVEYDVSIPDPLNPNIKVNLFGEDINNLIVVDYDDNVIKFQTGNKPNEIVFNTPGASNIRISYTTPDFLSKDKRDWIFSLNSTIGFSVKLPPDSILTDQGENQPSIRIVGGQSLLTFKPGRIQFVYVIGTLGTEEQANISIKSAQTTIEEVTSKHSGIILASAKDLVQKATAARNAGRFGDADKLADDANDAAIATERDYELAQKAIADAQVQIDSDASKGSDTTTARQLLQQANTVFANGNYSDAKNSANSAVAAIGSKPAEPGLPVSVIIAALVAAGSGVGTLVFLRNRKPMHILHQPQTLEDRDNPALDNNKTPMLRPPTEPRIEEQKPEEHGGVTEPTLEDNPAVPTTLHDSQTDKSTLSRIVGRIIEDRPNLRLEDQQVLRFLVEKEGAAFESEIRSRFQLPKTTIWRLVKRLEREELIEIRKAGGQNLIKLKFEDKQF